MNNPQESPLTFPAEFPIKATGRATPDFETKVIEIVRRHAPDLDTSAITRRTSQGGKYLAVTVTIQTASREQLDAIYQDLTACKEVLWAL
ncbi:MAG: YbeD family protein [Pseudomonadota bacterium]